MEADAADSVGVSADAGILYSTEQGYVSGDTLVWPIAGAVLIPYSMDKSVYFSTLNQYKRSPAIVMAAQEGDLITSVSSGRVTAVFYREDIGNAVTVSIGNGYEITYGQLKNIGVTEGNYVEKGSIIGYVNTPTKYYSVEGTNAYFALTKDGVAQDPLGALQ
jgi:septal ring factor EnvC (AmiA/AmiB activator)